MSLMTVQTVQTVHCSVPMMYFLPSFKPILSDSIIPLLQYSVFSRATIIPMYRDRLFLTSTVPPLPMPCADPSSALSHLAARAEREQQQPQDARSSAILGEPSHSGCERQRASKSSSVRPRAGASGQAPHAFGHAAQHRHSPPGVRRQCGADPAQYPAFGQ